MDITGTHPSEILQNPIEPRKDLDLLWNNIKNKVKIKQPIWLIISIILIFVGVGFLLDRIQLIQVGEHVVGQIVNISGSNTRCGSKNNKYDCTQFSGYVDFWSLKGQKGNITVGGGSTRGHNKPIDSASIQIGQNVKVIYDPSDIGRAYEDTLWGVWGAPILAFIFHIVSFLTAFAEPKKRNN